MSGYLLLRDNKQTGPYSFEELIEKGFKPYDLIWAEGKSAGWRYPSELPELARYAPAVEEQPFDRFFKKPGEMERERALERERERERMRERERERERENVQERERMRERERKTETIREEEEPRKSRVVVMKPRKIAITLPENADLVQASTPVASSETIVAFPEPILSVADSPEMKSLESKADEIRKRAMAASRPAADSAYRPPVENPSLKQTHFTNQPTAVIQEEKPINRPVADQRLRMSNGMVAAIAACLILGGVVIGLAISNSRQSAEQEQLSNYVQQKIKERKEARPSTSHTISDPEVKKDAETPAANEPGDKTTLPDNKPVENKESSIIQQVASKDKKGNTVINHSSPAATRVINTVQENNPSKTTEDATAIRISEKPAEPINTAAIEKARQKIYDLVSVEGSQYKVGDLGGISHLELTVSNNSSYPLDQVEVTVNYHGPEKRIVRKETVIISDIAAGEQKMVPVPKSKRGVSVTYAVSRINSRVLGLAHSGF